MSPLKVVRLLVLAVAVIGAFAAIPEIGLVHVILGLAMGIMSDQADKDNRMFFLVLAVALTAVSDAAGDLPVIGGYISAIMGNLSVMVNAGALGIVMMVVKDRVTE
ncbi:MAG: hypothetical protein HOE58_09120 [Porticoccaceae bacterium]|jgi:hypothetical protein|nr:hypothetical protein [Porticoccaceae bacterium]MBT3798115.1 hypothetical protein [Porticoccaceae bacterium]MBT4164953.1 hypothetical protein [Porticoccaceae bacterium]MBT5104360.1 hypothetical protein [Porticoccaceae bacterium]MBT6027057.1 hypothetical protein [Porticoccaceae bacterium]